MINFHFHHILKFVRFVSLMLACAQAVKDINYRPQRSWGKVIFSVACVKNSVHGGGSTWVGTPGQVHPPGQVQPPGRYTPGQVHHPPGQVPLWQVHPLDRYTTPAGTPPRQILRDTVNERMVRILLECILLVTACKRR